MTDSLQKGNISNKRQVQLAALILLIVVLAFYVFTLQPSLSWGDGIRLQREVITSESFILSELVDVEFAPDPFPFARLGVAAWDHPLYVIGGHILVKLLPGVDALWLVNMISAIFGAGTIAIFFVLCYENTGSLFASLFAALALTVAHTFWFHASTPEVYTLFSFLLLVSLYYYGVYERTNQQRALTTSFFFMGLGAANHILAFLALPAALLYLLLVKRFKPNNIRALLIPAAAFLVGFLPYVIQVIRMLRTFSFALLMSTMSGSTFLGGLPEATLNILLLSVITYLGYLIFQFSPIGFALGIYGFWKGKQGNASFWHKALAFFVVYALFGILYRVTDQFAFYFGSYVFFAMMIAIGTAQLARLWAEGKRRWLPVILGLSLIIMPTLYMLLPGYARAAGYTDAALGVPQVGTGVRDGLNFYLNPNKRGDVDAYHFGQEVMDSLPPDAMVVTQWYTDTDEYFVLRYFTVVYGMRPDVELLGWPKEAPIDFDSRLAVTALEGALDEGRPVYLASLSEKYYQASMILKQHCVVPEGNLYRVYPELPGAEEVQDLLCIQEATE